ncbi:hypothetical protein [Cochleicola gelatinilyticus]|uniref:Uncharacterized protein n=1 Tax=Cochleicola gelatinilyticus TaxID=1763537 RepID=A0A167HQD6_9FLAO|nr:hypothetical protein [Cochleicola gelatinilyticus]OAB78853.1 hypothetical protein ULVI_09740 [Cochleicola gelatinilyticus]
MFKNIAITLFLGISISASAQDTINTMFYNLLEFPEALPGAREQILQNILNQYEPDLFMVCELQSSQGANLILNTSLNDSGNRYSRASFVPNTSGEANLQQLIFFKNDVFSLENSEILQTSVRDINHYQLKLNTANQQAEPVFL